MRDEGNTWSQVCEECYEYDLSDEWSHCPYCGDSLLEPYIPPVKITTRGRRLWRELLYKLHLKKRPQTEVALNAAMSSYKASVIANIYNESPLITYLKEKQ